MCKKELLKKIKTKGSLVLIQKYVEDIMKEKYHDNLLDEEIFSLFEKVIDLAKSMYEEDKTSQKVDVTSIFIVLLSLCNKLEINIFDAFTEEKQKVLSEYYV
ncbi:MAG: hypothetical protein HFI08_00925 [Bacilli bacterium]|nr:hypothetical protein [Bacilli bacterium]